MKPLLSYLNVNFPQHIASQNNHPIASHGPSGCNHNYSGGCPGSAFLCSKSQLATWKVRKLEPSKWLFRDLSGKTFCPELPTGEVICLIKRVLEKLDIILPWFSIAGRKHSNKNWEASVVYFILHFQILIQHERNSRTDLKAKTMEKCCLLASSLALSLAETQLLCLYSPGLPAQGWQQSPWDGPFCIKQQSRKCTQTCTYQSG